MNIDKQLEKDIYESMDMSMILNFDDAVDKIKKTIYKEIMKKMPKKVHCGHLQHLEPCNDLEVIDFNNTVEMCKSVIKDLLSPKQ